MAKIIEFDLDGTLTKSAHYDFTNMAGCYMSRQPNLDMIALVHEADRCGWTIVIRTGRKERQRRLTETWLQEHGVPYHFLFMDKGLCTYRIDDANITAEEFKQVLADEKKPSN